MVLVRRVVWVVGFATGRSIFLLSRGGPRGFFLHSGHPAFSGTTSVPGPGGDRLPFQMKGDEYVVAP